MNSSSRRFSNSITTILLLFGLNDLFAQPPGILSHQGRIVVSGTNYEGTGYFKFALVDGAGATTYWSNDATSVAGAEPAAAVVVTVDKGLYAVLLGDTAFDPKMTNPIPISVFADHADVRLRIWFSTDNATFEPLSPDQRLAASPYALSAGQAATVSTGSVTADMLADGAVTNVKIANGAVTQSALASGAAAANIDADGSLGIGIEGSPLGAVHLNGDRGFVDARLLAAIKDGMGGFNELDQAFSVAVSGTVAFVTSFSDSSLTIIDVSSPSEPVLLAEIKDGVAGFNELGGAVSVAISGTTAFVTSFSDSSLTIIDVSSPSEPVLLAEIKDEVAGFDELGGANSVAISGTTAFVASGLDDSLTIIDVSDPTAPVLLAEVKGGVGGFNELDGAISVAVSGTTAYVASATDDSLTIIDVSVSTAPVLLAEIKDGVGGFNELNSPRSVAVSGSTAYVASLFDGSLTILDVSDSTAPVLLAEVKDGVGGFNELNGANSVAVSGTTAYVASALDDSLTVIDVTIPSAPVLIAEIKDGNSGFSELEGARSVSVSGTTAYVASSADDALTIIDISSQAIADLITTNRVGINTAHPAEMLHVVGDVRIDGSLIELTVGDDSASGGFDRGIAEIFQRASTEDDGLAIWNGATPTTRTMKLYIDENETARVESRNAGTGPLVLNSGGGRVGIGTVEPESSLHISGQMRVDGAAPKVIVGDDSTAAFVNSGTMEIFQRDTSEDGGLSIWNGSTPARVMKLYIDENEISRMESRNGGTGPLVFNTGGGNVGIGTATPTDTLEVNGSVTATAFNNTSDRDAKEAFEPIDPAQVLEKVASLPMTSWQFRESDGTRHIGPMAQDFHATFGFGSSERHIATVDADGVALAAIQGLHADMTRLMKSMQSLQEENRSLRERVKVLEDTAGRPHQSIEPPAQAHLGRVSP